MPETSNVRDWDHRIIAEFRTNGGKVGGPFAGVPMLLLTTTGTRSGEPRTVPLAYLADGGLLYVFAGNRGGPTNPAWYHNLVAHPEVTVEVGQEQFAATAIVLDAAEAERLGYIQLQKLPGLAETMSRVTRKIPAVLLEPQK